MTAENSKTQLKYKIKLKFKINKGIKSICIWGSAPKWKLFGKAKRWCILLFMGALKFEEKGPILNSDLNDWRIYRIEIVCF